MNLQAKSISLYNESVETKGNVTIQSTGEQNQPSAIYFCHFNGKMFPI